MQAKIGGRPLRAVAWTSTSITGWLRDCLTAAGQNPGEAPDEPFRFLRLPDVKARVGLSTSTIYRKVAAKEFPAPVPLDGTSVTDKKRALEKCLAPAI